jgi:hypothetical protein
MEENHDTKNKHEDKRRAKKNTHTLQNGKSGKYLRPNPE